MSTRYPPNFSSWPPDDQIVHVDMTMTRAGLIAGCLGHAGMRPVVEEIDRNHTLTKEELAGIYLALEGFR